MGYVGFPCRPRGSVPDRDPMLVHHEGTKAPKDGDVDCDREVCWCAVDYKPFSVPSLFSVPSVVKEPAISDGLQKPSCLRGEFSNGAKAWPR
jgi:hypothetical protein